MMLTKLIGIAAAAGLAASSFWWLGADELQPDRNKRDAVLKLMQDGNFKDAYEIFQKLATNAETSQKHVGDDLTHALDCLANLGRVDETDELIEASVAAQPKNWRLLWSAAKNYQRIEHFGYIIAGNFERGDRRGGGKYVSVAGIATGSGRCSR